MRHKACPLLAVGVLSGVILGTCTLERAIVASPAPILAEAPEPAPGAAADGMLPLPDLREAEEASPDAPPGPATRTPGGPLPRIAADSPTPTYELAPSGHEPSHALALPGPPPNPIPARRLAAADTAARAATSSGPGTAEARKPAVSTARAVASDASAAAFGPAMAAAAATSAVRPAAVTPPQAVATGTDATIQARSGKEVEVSLEGDGWVLLGVQAASAGTEGEGLAFLRRIPGRESTGFVFRADRPGAYHASFQRQVASTGSLVGRRLLVSVDAPLSAPAGEVLGGGDGKAPGGLEVTAARASADRLYGLGLYQSALTEYRRLAREIPGQAGIMARIAELDERLGNAQAAADGWAQVLDSPEVREQAVAGIVRTASLLGDGTRVDTTLDALFRIKGLDIGSEIVEVARYAERSGRNALELTVLEEYLRRYPGGEQADEVYFLLGGLLERAWEGRDLARSRACYETVVRSYPTSRFSLASGERIDYLMRHFFYVR